MEEEINVLDEVNKGACMGMDAIKFILDKIDSGKFRESLQVQYDKYATICDRINEIYPKYSKDSSPHETNALQKTMTWYGIEMRTVMNHSDSKVAELLLQGTNMGIIEGVKILNNKKVNEEVEKIVSDFVKMQEDSVENLKKYL